MPIVRRAERSVGLTALPNVRKRAAATPESEGAGLEQARAEQARAVGDVGRLVANVGLQKYAELQERTRREAEDVRLMSGERELSEFELARVHDPTTGVLHTMRGPDAMAVREPVLSEYDKLVTAIEVTLPPGRAIEAFRRVAHARRAGLDRTLTLNAGEQMEAYDRSETEAAVANAVKVTIARGPRDLVTLAEELQRVDGLVDRYADRARLGPEARAAARTKARTAIHEGLIERMLAQGEDRKAEIYFDEVRPQIAGDRLAALQRQVESASTAGAGLRAAERIWTALGPQDDEKPIELDRMEAAARAQVGDDAKILDATMKYLRERNATVVAGRAQRQDAIAGTLWRAVAEGASLDQVRRLPAYGAATGALQLDVSKSVVQQAEHRADRAYTQTERAFTATRRREAEQEQAGWARMWEISRPQTLMTMTEDQILGLLPELGVDHVNRLIETRRKYAASEDKVRTATIDQQLFNRIAESAGLHPYKPGLSEGERGTLGQLQDGVESAIAAEQTAKNRDLTRDEKAVVMQGIVDRRVMLDRWGSDVSAPTLLVRGADADTAYVPLDQIGQHDLDQWVNAIRSEFPREQRATRAQIVLRYRARIQRAHAAALLGLGDAAERQRLLGR